jgi:CheY-like chemotaxis protein
MLTAIRSFSELLLADMPDASPHRADVKEIQSAADRAAALTRQLLAFSRRQLLQPVPLDLNGVVGGVHEMLQRLLGEDVDLVCRLEPALHTAVADPGQIEQIVMNLAVNARDAMPDGGRLTLETANIALDEEYAARVGELEPGPYVVLSVSDTGEGMDAATLDRVFEPFFTTKAPGEGTGLGLSTVYGIVKQSGGHVAVYSEVGQGTTFRVYLPRAEGAGRPAPLPRKVMSDMPRGEETILLVEDDPAVRLVAARILARQGYRVLEAPTPTAAEALVAAHPGAIDLIMTDLVLPGMNGRELGELLTTVEPRLRVLYMSGYTDDAVIRRGLLEPGMPFLSKPFTVEELARMVRNTLDLQPS